MRFFLMVLVMVLVSSGVMSTAVAQPSFRVPGQSHAPAAASGKSSSPPNMRSIRSSPSMGSQQVAALVKRECNGCRILSVRMAPGQGPQVYKVKTLSSQGVIKYVFVDGDSGSVF